MRTPHVAFVALVALSTRRAHADALPAKPPVKVAGYVLVWQDAHFIVDPKQPTQTVQLATLTGDRSANLGSVAPFKVVSTQGDLVEVEPVADEHCVWTTMKPREVSSLRLFVARADLAPVLSKPFKASFKDGTQITLDAGTAVAAQGAGGYVALAGLDHAAVDIPDTSVGLSYPRVPHAFRGVHLPKVAAVYRAAAEATATLGPRTFTLAKDLHGYRFVIAAPKSDTTLVPLRSRCASGKVAVPSTSVADKGERGIGNIGTFGHGSGTGGPGSFLPKGTPLFSKSGNRIGITTGTTRATVADGVACVDIHASFLNGYLDAPKSTATGATVTACAKAGTKVTAQ